MKIHLVIAVALCVLASSCGRPQSTIVNPTSQHVHKALSDLDVPLPTVGNAVSVSTFDGLKGCEISLILPHTHTEARAFARAIGFTNALQTDVIVSVPSVVSPDYPWQFSMEFTNSTGSTNVLFKGIQFYD